ncbi:MAG TPA: helix-turn-helix transcriptional regulator [Gemmata sp.]|jgi:transcriptional regulator with XRE-family HTH domain|nr:helix-turn-helix transcriptional regulator [Gemmata sp.]
MNASAGGNNRPREAVDLDETSDISVGGLGVRLAALKAEDRRPELAAVGKAVELMRRERGLSTEKLALRAHVTEDALFDLERGLRMPNTRDVIRLVCVVLDIPADKLIAAAGLSGSPDPTLTSAAMRLASQAKMPEILSAPEHAALNEFMGAIAGK